jgi:hypothetical protein
MFVPQSVTITQSRGDVTSRRLQQLAARDQDRDTGAYVTANFNR